MSFLGRLFGGAQPALPATAVVLPDDVAGALTADGRPLQEAVVAALRAHLAATPATTPPETPAAPGERVPFWLAREAGAGDGHAIEDRLRDRLEHRRGGDDAPAAE